MLFALLLAPCSATFTVPGAMSRPRPWWWTTTSSSVPPEPLTHLTADGSRLRRRWSGEVGHRRQGDHAARHGRCGADARRLLGLWRGPNRSSLHGRAVCLKRVLRTQASRCGSQHDGPRWGLTATPSWLTRACSSPRETASSCVAQATARCCTRQKQASVGGIQPRWSTGRCTLGMNPVGCGVGPQGRRLRSSNLRRHPPCAVGDQRRIARAPPNPKIQPRPMASPERGPPPTSPSQAHRMTSGASPGMPVALNGTTAAVGDASGVHVLEWTEDGWDVTGVRPPRCKGRSGPGAVADGFDQRPGWRLFRVRHHV